MRGVSSQVSGKVSVLGCPDRASVKVRKKIVHSEVKRLTGYSLGTRSLRKRSDSVKAEG
jgi:hypothetical protein